MGPGAGFDTHLLMVITIASSMTNQVSNLNSWSLVVAIRNLRFKISLVLTVNNLVFLVLFRNLMKDLMLIWYITTAISNVAPCILCCQKLTSSVMWSLLATGKYFGLQNCNWVYTVVVITCSNCIQYFLSLLRYVFKW